MRLRENYTPLIAAAFGLTLTVLIVFQIYVIREPSRIEAQEAVDRTAAIMAGEQLFAGSCVPCHGETGQGGIGPALNSREFLTITSDEALFNLVRTGVPGTGMPAWGQVFGGSFTDEQVAQLVAYVRSWEADAPEIAAAAETPDPVRGAAIYSRTCSICHGENGAGTDRAPALNDPRRLSRLDDVWYRNTIAHGRPARGMPTWGTVLSPLQIDDVVALIAVWREGRTISEDIPLATYLVNALFAIREFDAVDAEFYLTGALAVADESQTAEILEIIELVRQNQLFIAQGRVATLLPPEEMGQALYANNCATCHGTDGTGNLGPNLHDNPFVQRQSDQELVTFLLNGRRGTAMNGFEGILTEDELGNLVSLLRSWQN